MYGAETRKNCSKPKLDNERQHVLGQQSERQPNGVCDKDCVFEQACVKQLVLPQVQASGGFASSQMCQK